MRKRDRGDMERDRDKERERVRVHLYAVEVGKASLDWPSLMQPILIFITPTSCACDTLDFSGPPKCTTPCPPNLSSFQISLVYIFCLPLCMALSPFLPVSLPLHLQLSPLFLSLSLSLSHSPDVSLSLSASNTLLRLSLFLSPNVCLSPVCLSHFPPGSLIILVESSSTLIPSSISVCQSATLMARGHARPSKSVKTNA